MEGNSEACVHAVLVINVSYHSIWLQLQFFYVSAIIRIMMV